MIPTCVNPEVEDYTGRKKTKGQMPGKIGVIEDGEQRNERYHVGPKDEGDIAVKERCGENKPMEETREAELSTKDKMKEDNANTGRHIPGGTWLIQV
ncbi:hypothetical protein NDU88_003416 [Pleurodeles waltl]|uniref:Uncharacterized protein n=1 Tax=Pleurodeles waltl TaxID=8319 RepID=A0AAV7NQU8_PLEWA|nr:hypothetical protein NDU88_003416 [Pleurodeles waltl]